MPTSIMSASTSTSNGEDLATRFRRSRSRMSSSGSNHSSSSSMTSDARERSGGMSGQELEEFANAHGLCPLCAQTKTRKRVLKLWSRRKSKGSEEGESGGGKWEPLTVKDKTSGHYLVYKGYCVKPSCFSLDQAKRLVGETAADGESEADVPAKRPMMPKFQKKSSKSTIAEELSERMDLQHYDLMASSKRNTPGAFPSPEMVEQHRSDTNLLIHKTALALQQDQSITTLDLSSVELDMQKLKMITSALPKNSTVHNLVLEGCKLDDAGVAMLADSLASATNLPLTKLYLRSNQFGDDGIEALANNFLHASSTVQKLDVSRNRITSPGGIVLFHALSRNQDTGMRCINLSHNELCEVDSTLENGHSVGLCDLLTHNRSLRVLNLEGNVLHNISCESIAKGIRKSGTNAKLERLYLGWNGIGDDGTIALAKMLETNSSLRMLGLGENDIGTPGARALLSAMDSNMKLKEISGLWRNHIDRRFIIVAIRRLLLSHNDENKDSEEQSTLHDSDSALRVSVPEHPTEVIPPSESAPPSPKKLPSSPMPDVDIPKAEEPKRSVSEPTVPEAPKRETSLSRNASVPTVVKSSKSTVGFDRLTVVQSAPLIHHDREAQTRRPIPLYDFEYESDILKRSISASTKAKIEVGFESPTLENMTKYIKNCEDRILHISCRGDDKHLFLENGFGSLHSVPLEELPSLIKSVSAKLQVVFVSSDHAFDIGKAFLLAGVQHVICCRRDAQFRDYVATKFTVVFYQALAQNKSLVSAFNNARSAVMESPHSKNTRIVTQRFQLLPDDENVHDVPVFFDGSTTETSRVPPPQNLPLLPRMPQHFVGREVDMYEILEALRVEDVVKVTGAPGSGKNAVVASACRYVMRRQETFKVDQVLWLPATEAATAKNVPYTDLCHLYNLTVTGKRDVSDDDLKTQYWSHIGKEFLGKRIIIVIDDRQSSSKRPSPERLDKFISCLLELASVKIILMTPTLPDDHSIISMSTPGSSMNESSIEIGPLDFRSTALLFAGVSKFITSGGCPAAHTPKEFLELLQPPHIAAIEGSVGMSKRLTDLFERLGKGVPRDVTNMAKRMTKNLFIELIQVASAPEVLANSLSTLEGSIARLEAQKQRCVAEKNFLRASDLELVLNELDGMRSNFSSLDDLKRQEAELKKQLATVVANRQYDVANNLKRQMLDLKKRIMKERRGAVDSSATANLRINDIQTRVQKMIDTSSTHSERGRSATFLVNCRDRDCSFVISCGNPLDFRHASDEAGLICWTNENCDIKKHTFGQTVIDEGGDGLQKDVSCLPVIKETRWGDVRCETGNAVMIGPEKYGKLGVSFVIFSVGPVSPSNQDEIDIEDKDGQHYTNIMLRSSYRSSLVLVKHAQLQAIALNMLTTKPGGFGWEKNLQVGLETLIEGVHQSHLREVQIYASSPRESAMLIEIATQIGLRRS